MAKKVIIDKKTKARYWTAIIYPESMPDDWRDILDMQGTVYCCSLHNCDSKTDGTLKKEHWHVIFKFDGPTSYAVVETIVQLLGSNEPPQQVRNLRSMIRYLVHADNPNKYQYPVGQIFSHGMGDDIEDAFDSTLTEKGKKTALRNQYFELDKLIKDNHITHWSDLNKQLQELDDGLLNFATGNAYLVTQWLLDQFHIIQNERGNNNLLTEKEEQQINEIAKTVKQANSDE